MLYWFPWQLVSFHCSVNYMRMHLLCTACQSTPSDETIALYMKAIQGTDWTGLFSLFNGRKKETYVMFINIMNNILKRVPKSSWHCSITCWAPSFTRYCTLVALQLSLDVVLCLTLHAVIYEHLEGRTRNLIQGLSGINMYVLISLTPPDNICAPSLGLPCRMTLHPIRVAVI